MVAVRRLFTPLRFSPSRLPLDHIGGGGRLSLNVVSSGGRTKRKNTESISNNTMTATHEQLMAEVVDGMWKQDGFSFAGKYYRVEDGTLAPKPITKPRPVIYAAVNRKRRRI